MNELEIKNASKNSSRCKKLAWSCKSYSFQSKLSLVWINLQKQELVWRLDDKSISADSKNSVKFTWTRYIIPHRVYKGVGVNYLSHIGGRRARRVGGRLRGTRWTHSRILKQAKPNISASSHSPSGVLSLVSVSVELKCKSLATGRKLRDVFNVHLKTCSLVSGRSRFC